MSYLNILQYKGRSIISRLIKIQTRSSYSHTALQTADGSVYEAWDSGVMKSPDYRTLHKAGTEVHVYKIEVTDEQRSKIMSFLESKLGEKYDYRNVIRFFTRNKPSENNKWFCSELVLTAFKEAGKPLLNINPALAAPRDVPMSPYLPEHPYIMKVPNATTKT